MFQSGVWGLGFRVWSFGFWADRASRTWGLGFDAKGLGVVETLPTRV